MADKYKKLKRQVSIDGGFTWSDLIPYEYKAGELIQRDSPDCNNVEWRTVSGYICEENTTEMTQWVADTGYVCVGFDKYNKEKEQVSYNSGISWADTGNTRAGSTLIELHSEDCGYSPSYANQYLTIEALGSGNISLNNNTRQGCTPYGQRTIPLSNIQYSKNRGEWTSYTYGTNISVVNGDNVRWKATWNEGNDICFHSTINCTAQHIAYGNPLSIILGSNFSGVTDISSYDLIFDELFNGDTTLTDASNLALVATTLGYGCYYSMFAGCTSLTAVPLLPATIMVENEDPEGYPEGCYEYMFEGCTSLTTAPVLPATTLAWHCYHGMFMGCTSLTSAPALPATNLNTGPTSEYPSGPWSCYGYMFADCTSLTTAPELPATTLINRCYESMFYGCTSLNSVTCCATDISASNCTNEWLYNVAATGTFHKDANTTWPTGTSGIPSGWTTDTCGCEHDYSRDYLTLEALEDGWFSIQRFDTSTYPLTNIQYSKNNDSWTSYTYGTNVFVNTGDTVRWKASLSAGNSSSNSSRIWTSARYKAYGNPLSLLSGDNFANIRDISGIPYAFAYLFTYVSGQNYLIDASNLSLPATTLGEHCYQGIFYGCRLLTSVPELPAMTLTNYCYYLMFKECTSLTTAPELPATTLGETCYRDMFMHCTSLTTVPNILPASTLLLSCYQSMFQGCTSLTTAPILPAERLADGCYADMFKDCTSLNNVTCYAKYNFSTYRTYDWLSGVSSTGTFTKAAGVTWSTGTDGIPSGWTVVDAT